MERTRGTVPGNVQHYQLLDCHTAYPHYPHNPVQQSRTHHMTSSLF